MKMIGKMKREEVWADDINNLIADMIDVAADKVTLTDKEQDELWELLQAPMEKFFGYPQFRHHN